MGLECTHAESQASPRARRELAVILQRVFDHPPSQKTTEILLEAAPHPQQRAQRYCPLIQWVTFDPSEGEPGKGRFVSHRASKAKNNQRLYGIFVLPAVCGVNCREMHFFKNKILENHPLHHRPQLINYLYGITICHVFHSN